MATLIYPGPHESVRVLALGRHVPAGQPIDVDDEALADQLVAQGWHPAAAVPASGAAVADVVAWVAGDPSRAAVALAVEQDRGPKARKTLVATLSELAATTNPADEATNQGD